MSVRQILQLRMDSRLYLVLGGLSLLKALLLRGDPQRSQQELRDAGLFLGIGLVLHKTETWKQQHTPTAWNRLQERLPQESPAPGRRERLRQRLAGLSGSDDQPQAQSLRQRTRQRLSQR